MGNFADITIFDPATINGVADYASGTSSLPSKGFVHVLVTGKPVVSEGNLIDGTYPGEPIVFKLGFMTISLFFFSVDASKTGRPPALPGDSLLKERYLEFSPAPLSFGGAYVDPSQCALKVTGLGNLRIITPTHSIVDRLMAAVAWNEPQSLEQALLVAGHQLKNLDRDKLDHWVISEGISGGEETI